MKERSRTEQLSWLWQAIDKTLLIRIIAAYFQYTVSAFDQTLLNVYASKLTSFICLGKSAGGEDQIKQIKGGVTI